MQIRGQFSDFFFETALPAINAKIWQSFKAKSPMAKLLLNSDTTTRSIEQFSQMTGVGLPTLIVETEDTPTDSMVQGFNKTFRPAKYGLGIACSQELVEDDKMGIVARRGVALSNSIFQSREIQAASVFNNAFDGTNFPLPDLKALCASDHPLVKAGGTQNNLLSVAADLDVTSLELALTDWELIKTHEGFLQMLPKPRVLVAAQNRWNVSEILKSQMRSDTANNTRNAFQDSEQGGTIESLCWSYLTDPDAWFLVAPPAETETLWLDRKAPYTKSDFIEKNETGFVYMRYRATYGAYGFRGVYGTPGA
jgi:hypothetical protein